MIRPVVREIQPAGHYYSGNSKNIDLAPLCLCIQQSPGIQCTIQKMEKTKFSHLARLHIEKFWPSSNKREFVWDSGPIRKWFSDFSVCQIEPAKPDDEWVYITMGASEIHAPNNQHVEFFVLSAREEPMLVDTMAMLANLHANPEHSLCLGKMINIGRPWTRNSKCNHFLVSLPYTLGKDFEWFAKDEIKIRFLWLLPITLSEAEYARINGVEALEQKFEEKGVEYLDPNRQSVI